MTLHPLLCRAVQLLTRAQLVGEASGSNLTFACALSTGPRISSITVKVHVEANKANRVVASSMLQQAGDAVAADQPNEYRLNVDSPAFAERVYHIWLGAQRLVHLDMRAAADPQQLPLQPGDSFSLAVRASGDTSPSCDQADIVVMVTGQQQGQLWGTFSTAAGRSMPVRLKLGLSQGLRALAAHLRPGDWQQAHQVGECGYGRRA